MRSDLDQTSGVAHREALLLGDSFVIVWADPFGRPRVTVESAKQVGVLTDPGSRQIVAALKRWEDTTRKTTEAVLYLPDRIVRLRANQVGAVTAQGLATVEELANPLGVVPVVNLRNSDRILGEHGSSEIDDLQAAGGRAQQVPGRHDGHLRMRRPPPPLGHRDRTDRGTRPHSTRATTPAKRWRSARSPKAHEP